MIEAFSAVFESLSGVTESVSGIAAQLSEKILPRGVEGAFKAALEKTPIDKISESPGLSADQLESALPSESINAPEQMAAKDLSSEIKPSTWEEKLVDADGGGAYYRLEAGRDSTLLNGDLPRNSTVVVDNPIGDNTLTLKIDEEGRVSEMAIDKLSRVDGVRDQFQQSRCNEIKDALPGDNAGHLLAREFGGPFEQFNYLPMDGYSNKYGQWRTMEKGWERALSEGKSVTDIKITPSFDGACKRPDELVASYRIDGERVYDYIDNTPREVKSEG